MSLVRRAKNAVRRLLAGRVRTFGWCMSFVEGKRDLDLRVLGIRCQPLILVRSHAYSAPAAVASVHPLSTAR